MKKNLALTTFMALGIFVISPANSSNTGDFSFSCNNSKDQLCGDYTFQVKSEYDKAVKQCRSYGAEVTNGCSPAPSCLSTRAVNTYRTYRYDSSVRSVKTNCLGAGGKFIN